MSRIKIMSRTLASRIAAGEVIERPASVVKELVENSIDAGATEITVEIERAGSRLIAVTDNGCGMDHEDAMLALQQHGTSKLLDEKDLDHIMTLGFRGEALPSIASVSKFSLFTRQPEAPDGIIVSCDIDGEISSRPGGGAPGTRIEVRDLFCNLPARKKFLKSPATEEHHIEEVFSMMALAHVEISFKLIIDKRIALHTPATGNLSYRLREIFGKSFVDNMLFFEHTEGDLFLSGCIAAPGFTRPSRRDQRVFINSRPVEAQAVFRGIKEGYATLAEPGRYNPVVLFLEMPPEDIDVNVHPAKREVRFKAEYTISRAIAAAVSGALRRNGEEKRSKPDEFADKFLTASGKLPLSMIMDAAEISYNPIREEQPVLPAEGIIQNFTPEEISAGTDAVIPDVPENGKDGTEEEFFPDNGTAPIPVTPSHPLSPLVKPVSPAAFSGVWPHRIIGVIDNTYILTESSCGLVLIDQHAAHERIMFEKIISGMTAGKSECQRLLIPETVELPRSMIKLLLGNKELFESLGFEVESAGGTTVIVSSIPLTPCTHRSIADWLHDMLDELLANGTSTSAVDPQFAAGAACKAAVKAHDPLPPEALEALLSGLKACRQGTLCPHGRPTMVELSIKELERRFGRR